LSHPAGGSKLHQPLFPVLAAFVLFAAAPPVATPTAAPARTAGAPATTSAAPSAPNAEAAAVEAYKHGLALFDGGDKAQALIEFQLAQQLAPSPKNLFMMAQCEYHLGRFKEARAHYQQFIAQESKSVYAETARQRIEAINRRQGVIIVQSAPLGVDITLERQDGPAKIITGQAPGEFRVPAGKWLVTARKQNYQPESVNVTLDSVDTVPLFFSLERQPAHLEITTVPYNATLYVRGNRARNPYVQEVEPGAYEIYAEAPSYESRSETFIVAPGERRKIRFPLHYVQRSGRPELIGFWTAAGAFAGATAVLARIDVVDKTSTDASSVGATGAVVAGAALVGGVAGALASTAALPDYIPDNRALFRIGASWIGAAEGATVASIFRPTLASAAIGGALGLGLGAAAGTVFDEKAPNYGRVAIIQSGAAVGMMAGALALPAFDIGVQHPERKPLTLLAGLNLGLGAGLALAYLPDQTSYGPTWRRVLLVDLAVAAGTVAGALVNIMGRCLRDKDQEICSFDSDESKGKTDAEAAKDRQQTAQFALIGAGVGLVAGWLLTQDYDRNNSAPLESAPLAAIPVPTLLPVTTSDGGTRLVPGLVTQGRF
jgi:hypothetical protein